VRASARTSAARRLKLARKQKRQVMMARAEAVVDLLEMGKVSSKPESGRFAGARRFLHHQTLI